MINIQTHPRLLVIDNEVRVREDLRDIFKPMGYEVQIADGSGPALLNDAKNKAVNFRPHVAIVDMRLLLDGDPNDRSGVELIKTLDPSHCILYSSYISLELSRELSDFKAAGWIGKQEPPSKLVDMVGKIARESSAERKNFRIDKNSVDFIKQSQTLLGMESEPPSNLIQDVLSQVFPNESGVTVDTIPGAVKTPMSASRGRSLILKVIRDNMTEPFIVKLAKKEDISQEYDNYKKYIEGNLKGGFYSHLIGEPIYFWDIGAIVYTFIGASHQNIVFSKHYQREENSERILKPLQVFFGEVWRGLYTSKTGSLTTSLFASYDEYLKLGERMANYPEQPEYCVFRGIDMDMPNPIPWVRKHGDSSFAMNARWAVTHGDLHGDNIFVDDDHVWAIDFERSKEGHILRDFTEMEVDILTRLARKKDEKDMREFFYLLTFLSNPYYFKEIRDPTEHIGNEELHKAFNVIKGLRVLARDITNFDDTREYVWSLLFDLVFVITYKGVEPLQRERALLYGSILCSSLSQWGSKWPPEDWKPFLAGIESQSVSLFKKMAAESGAPNAGKSESTSQNDKRTAKNVSFKATNVMLAGVFLFLGVIGVVILWWAMSLFGITFQNALVTFILITLFAIIIFALLGLVTGQAALNALTRIFAAIFEKRVKPTNNATKHHKNTENEENEK